MKIENKMREIKFRAWDGEKMWEIDGNSKVVLEFNKISGWNILPNKHNYQGKYLAGESATNKEFHLMQFTGLKDKNGVEIYEGDIVETFGSKYADEKWVEVRHVSVIEWWQSSSRLGYRLKNSKGKTMMIKPYALTNTMKAKVIGNIHEHKHLLK